MAVRSLVFSPDSSSLLTASDDMHVKMYDVYVLTVLPWPHSFLDKAAHSFLLFRGMLRGYSR